MVNKNRVISTFLRGTLIIISTSMIGGCGYSLKKETSKEQSNQTGYENIDLTNILKINQENFVVLNVGDHNSIKLLFEDEKMKYCDDKDIAVGIVISSDAETEDEIYNDVEYTKGIIEKHNVRFPVYLNIDNIITNDNLNNEMKTEIIRSYLDKVSANKIYVGITGTDTNLCRVRKYCDITEYDAFLVMDSETINYEGTYNMVKKLDGSIQSYVDLESVIKKNDLNNLENFVSDGLYVVSKNEDIIDIALKYGMSVNELLDYNEISKKDIIEGCCLRIPSIIEKKVSNTPSKTEFKKLDEPIRGCDMSYCQGNNTDWEQLQENFEFIILKSNQGLNKDSMFENNAKNCSLYNIPIGVYCYNDFNKSNCNTMEEFIKKQYEQADYTLELLKNKNIEYPVYLDIEGNIESNLGKEYIKKMLEIWGEKMIGAGVVPGIYCNQSHFKYIQKCVDYNISDVMEVWIAGGDQYGDENNPSDNINFEKVTPSHVLENEEFGATMAQSTNVATGAGAQDGRKHLDVNFCIADYIEKENVKDPKNQFATKEFNFRDNLTKVADTLAILIPSVGISTVALKTYKYKKRKNKMNK